MSKYFEQTFILTLTDFLGSNAHRHTEKEGLISHTKKNKTCNYSRSDAHICNTFNIAVYIMYTDCLSAHTTTAIHPFTNFMYKVYQKHLLLRALFVVCLFIYSLIHSTLLFRKSTHRSMAASQTATSIPRTISAMMARRPASITLAWGEMMVPAATAEGAVALKDT